MDETDRNATPRVGAEDVQFSGIVVVTRPERIDEVAARVNALPGLEVYARHPGSGRLVVVQEAPDADAHERGLRAIQALPDVVTADLVYHVVDPDAFADDAGPGHPTGRKGPTRT